MLSLPVPVESACTIFALPARPLLQRYARNRYSPLFVPDSTLPVFHTADVSKPACSWAELNGHAHSIKQACLQYSPIKLCSFAKAFRCTNVKFSRSWSRYMGLPVVGAAKRAMDGFVDRHNVFLIGWQIAARQPFQHCRASAELVRADSSGTYDTRSSSSPPSSCRCARRC